MTELVPVISVRVARRRTPFPRVREEVKGMWKDASMPLPGFAEPVIGPATSGRTRWLNPGYEERMRRKRNADRRSCMKPCQRARRRATDQGRLAPTRPLSGALACRRSTTVPARESVPSPRRGHGPGFMGDGATRCGFATRQRQTHLQRCTSRAGPSAGGHDARAARERVVTPPAGTVLAPTAGPTSRRCPSLSESSGRVSETETEVKGPVSETETIWPG